LQAETKAEELVKHFLWEQKRTKNDWDWVSTVHNLHDDPDKLKYYTNLQEWATEHSESSNHVNGGSNQMETDSTPLIQV